MRIPLFARLFQLLPRGQSIAFILSLLKHHQPVVGQTDHHLTIWPSSIFKTPARAQAEWEEMRASLKRARLSPGMPVWVGSLRRQGFMPKVRQTGAPVWNRLEVGPVGVSLGGRSFIEGLPIGLGLHAALIPCFPRPAFLLYPSCRPSCRPDCRPSCRPS